MDYLKHTIVFLVIAVVLNSAAVWLQSEFFKDFFGNNLIALLVALLAINTTTIGVISTKLADLHEQYQLDFSTSIRSMKNSILEQVILIVLATTVSIASSSAIVTSLWKWFPFIFNTVLITIFIYAIYILYDTANGIFVILQKENSV